MVCDKPQVDLDVCRVKQEQLCTVPCTPSLLPKVEMFVCTGTRMKSLRATTSFLQSALKMDHGWVFLMTMTQGEQAGDTRRGI